MYRRLGTLGLYFVLFQTRVANPGSNLKKFWPRLRTPGPIYYIILNIGFSTSGSRKTKNRHLPSATDMPKTPPFFENKKMVVVFYNKIPKIIFFFFGKNILYINLAFKCEVSRWSKKFKVHLSVCENTLKKVLFRWALMVTHYEWEHILKRKKQCPSPLLILLQQEK